VSWKILDSAWVRLGP